MAREGAKYTAYNGSKLEYKESSGSSFTRIYGLRQTPDVGGTPNKIDTTDLDNLKFETAINGLQPAQEFDFEFNMEDPEATSNIYLVSQMEDSGKVYSFKYTLANGITIEFDSDVRTTILGGSTGDLIGFQMHLSPISEPVVTVTPAEEGLSLNEEENTTK